MIDVHPLPRWNGEEQSDYLLAVARCPRAFAKPHRPAPVRVLRPCHAPMI